MFQRLLPPLARLLTPGATVRKRLRMLEEAHDAPGPRLASGIVQAMTQQYSSDEQAVIHAVEHTRARLRASGDMVEVVDFGAGSKWRADAPDTIPALRVASLVRRVSCPPRWCRLIFSLIRSVRPAHCLELGTHLGISGLTIASALRLNGKGSLTTIEGSPALSDYAAQLLASSGLSNTRFLKGRFADVLPPLLSEHTPFDFVFIDGHHQYEATVQYFRLLRDAFRHSSIMLFDDIRWSAGMLQAWKEVSSDPGAVLSIDLGDMGIIVCDPTMTVRMTVSVPY